MAEANTHYDAMVAEDTWQAFDGLNESQPGFRPAHAEGMLFAGGGVANARKAVDVVLDAAGGEMPERFWSILAKHSDAAATSLVETWIDQTERRTWFLNEIITEL
jgi:hypothetical protein